jgi:hypothetical protein
MRIEGDTLVFRPDIRFFGAEANGEKPNTARLVDEAEKDAIFTLWMKGDPMKIRIDARHGARGFTRDITHICEAGDILGKRLIIISWRHVDD